MANAALEFLTQVVAGKILITPGGRIDLPPKEAESFCSFCIEVGLIYAFWDRPARIRQTDWLI